MYLAINTCSAPGFRPGSNWTKACFSSDGRYIACGSSDGNIYVWQEANLVATLSKHSSSVCGVVWSNLGGSALFSASDRERGLVEWTHDEL